MKKFSVSVRVQVERAVMVDAESPSQAEELAMEVMVQEYGSDVLIFPQDAMEVAGETRTATYVCQNCGEASPKVAWGPGHIRCPKCKETTLTAADIEKANEAVEALRAETFGLAMIPG